MVGCMLVHSSSFRAVIRRYFVIMSIIPDGERLCKRRILLAKIIKTPYNRKSVSNEYEKSLPPVQTASSIKRGG